MKTYVKPVSRTATEAATWDGIRIRLIAMGRPTARLAEQMAKGAELDAVIREKLGGLGYAV